MVPTKNILNLLLTADYILVENLDTYKYLEKLSPKIKAKKITFNPSLAITNNLNIISLDQMLSKSFYSRLNKNLKKYTSQIYNTILKEKKNPYLARIVSDFIIGKENILVRLYQILKTCKKKKIVAIEPNFEKPKIANSVNSNLYEVLKLLNNVTVIKFNHLLINQKKNLARDPVTNFWIRLKFESILV